MLPKEEPEMRFKTYAAKFREIKISENYVEIVEVLLSSYRAFGCQHVFETPFPATSPGFFPENIGVVSGGTVKGFIRIYTEWKKDTEANGNQICWLTTAGRLFWRHRQTITGDKMSF